MRLEFLYGIFRNGVVGKAKKNEEEDLFALPPLNNEKALLNSSDDEREEQWIKRSSTRDAVYGSAMMVR